MNNDTMVVYILGIVISVIGVVILAMGRGWLDNYGSRNIHNILGC